MLSAAKQDIVNRKSDAVVTALLADEQVQTGDKQVSDSASAPGYGLRLEADLKQKFLSCPTSQKIIAVLHQGDRLRDAAALAFVSVEVARKVIAVMQKQ